MDIHSENMENTRLFHLIDDNADLQYIYSIINKIHRPNLENSIAEWGMSNLVKDYKIVSIIGC